MLCIASKARYCRETEKNRDRQRQTAREGGKGGDRHGERRRETERESASERETDRQTERQIRAMKRPPDLCTNQAIEGKTREEACQLLHGPQVCMPKEPYM